MSAGARSAGSAGEALGRGPGSEWWRLAGDFAALWSGVLDEVRGRPAAEWPAVYARGAQRLATLVARSPLPASEPGGLLALLIRVASAGASTASGDRLLAFSQALARLQAAQLALAEVERGVLVEGCARFGQRAAASGAGGRTLCAHLALWIECLDGAQQSANRQGPAIVAQAGVANAVLGVVEILGADVRAAARRAGLVGDDDVSALEARLALLEARLAAYEAGASARPAPRKARAKKALRTAKPARAAKVKAAAKSKAQTRGPRVARRSTRRSGR